MFGLYDYNSFNSFISFKKIDDLKGKFNKVQIFKINSLKM